MTKYQETINYLYNLRRMNPKWSTRPVRDFLDFLGCPAKNFKTVIVGGTNGKGSTCVFLERILQEAGLKTGLYTSPHLIDFKERIRVNDQKIKPEEVVELVGKLKPKIENLKKKGEHLSFHEVLVPMSFLYFKKKRIDIAILEVGLGGRLDATNTTNPELAIITNIDLDHTRYLGNTRQKIAQEKFAITRPGGVLLTSAQGEGLRTLKSLAKEDNVELIEVGRPKPFFLKIGLLGDYQQLNANLAAEAAKKLVPSISEKSIKQGIAKTKWPGRFEVHGNMILDSAHNPAGLKAFLSSLRKYAKSRKVVLVFGVSYPVSGNDLDEKKIKGMVRILEKNQDLFKKIILTQADYRGVEPEKLTKYFFTKNRLELISDPDKAVEKASGLVGCKDLVAVLGSIFLVGQVLPRLIQKSGA